MRLYGWFGLALLAVSQYAMFRKMEPFYSWFYCFAWWSYILLADNLLLKLRGASLLSTRRRELLTMLPLSVFIWLLFEAYNFAIHNWTYNRVPAAIWLRWPGYALAFATVLPGIFITSDLLQYILFPSSRQTWASGVEPLREAPSTAPSPGAQTAGLGLSVAPLLLPRIFFPTVWLGPLFLLDPVLEKLRLSSLSLQISRGQRARVWSLLLGGLFCGLMWEFWNFWAASKWLYTVPFFGGWKIFEMPILGFLGFAPFALECWVLYHVLRSVARNIGSPSRRLALWVAIALFCAIMFRGIDAHTVLHFAGPS
jgi:hypothetical protein